MAAERAPTIATTIQSRRQRQSGDIEIRVAPGQQRAGERERQREYRVLELDHVEREPEAFQNFRMLRETEADTIL